MSKLDFLRGTNVGAIFGDEMHYGGRTANYQNLKDVFKPTLDLAVTATPTRFLLKQYRNKYIFTEWERQMLKRQGYTDFQSAVTPVQFTVKFDEIISSVDTKWGTADVTNVSGVVVSDDTDAKKQLINLIWLNKFYKGFDGKRKSNEFNINNVISHCSGCDFTGETLKHGVAILPMNSKKITEFVKIANKMQNEYLFIAATDGKITDGKQPVGDNIEETISRFERQNIKTVTCTCYMFIEGVTVPDWNYVVWLDNNKSVSKYFQGNGRGLSQYKDNSKKYMFTFDFDWNRCLILNDEMMQSAMENAGKHNLEDFITEYGIHCNPIFLYIDGKYQEIKSTVQYHELLAEAVKTSNKVDYILDEFDDDEIVNNETILKSLIYQDKDLRLKFGTDDKKLEKFTENYKSGKAKKSAGEKLTKEESEAIKTIEDLRNKLRTIINCLPELAFCCEETKFENILNNSKYADLVIEVLNINHIELKQLFEGHDLSKIDMVIANMWDDLKTLDRYQFEAKWLAQYTTNEESNTKSENEEVTRNSINYIDLIF